MERIMARCNGRGGSDPEQVREGGTVMRPTAPRLCDFDSLEDYEMALERWEIAVDDYICQSEDDWMMFNN